jgi:hypothetical protein
MRVLSQLVVCFRIYFHAFNHYLVVTVWPAEENGKSVVSAEYSDPNPNITLKNLCVSFPCHTKESPNVSHVDGEYTFDPRDQILNWHVNEIDSNSSGSLEFSIREVPQDKFFPVHVTFSSDTLFSGVKIEGVFNNDASVEYSAENSVIVEEYTIQ